MVSCFVFGCYSNQKGGEKCHSFAFPKAHLLRRKWEHQINRKRKATDSSVVCEKHFTEGDFMPEIDNRGRKRLKKKLNPTAFPSKYLRGEPKIIEVEKRVTKTSSKALKDPEPTSLSASEVNLNPDHPFPAL